MKRPFLALIFLLILGLGALVYFAQGLFFKKEAASPAEEYIKKLGIERPGNKAVAPDFTLEDLSGRPLSLKKLRGEVVFLNFWATWCVPCRQEMPTMEKLYQEFKGRGLVVVAVNYRETKEEIQKFVDELGLTFPVLVDRDGRVSETYGVWSIPLSYFIDRKGDFIGKVSGYRRWDGPEGRAFFRMMLNEGDGLVP